VVGRPPQRDEVWLVTLDPTQGVEIQKTRPCLERVSKIVCCVSAIPVSAMKLGIGGPQESSSLLFETSSSHLTR